MDSSHASRAFDRAALALTGGGLLSAYASWLHMRELTQAYGVICGSGFQAAAHCSACFASTSLLALGGVTFILARAADRAAPPSRVRIHQSV